MNSTSNPHAHPDVDVVVIGAGFAGLYMLHRLRSNGFSVLLLEAGAGVGGTWYWNRYPGARCDVPSHDYSFGFDERLQQEWSWSENMAAQPELERYLQHVADRFGLHRDIRLSSRVSAMTWDERTSTWSVATTDGFTLRSRFVVSATGNLSVPMVPSIPGLGTFAGTVLHTGTWPADAPDLSSMRVGVIGTGSSGVQTVTALAGKVAHLTVFQRSPVYTMRVDVGPTDPAHEAIIKAGYGTIRAQQRRSPVGLHMEEDAARRSGLGLYFSLSSRRRIIETLPEERDALVDEHGFAAPFMFGDIHTNDVANDLARAMYAKAIRNVVRDPLLAEALTPRERLGCKRMVVDTGYYEVFNRRDVKLVDLRRGDIVTVKPGGIDTMQGFEALDAIVLATGFDAVTGALGRITITGRDGVRLAERWAGGPRTYLGLQVHGFPNLFTVTGPSSPAVLTNVVVSIEQHVEWIADCLAHVRSSGARTVEPTRAAEDEWVEHVAATAEGSNFTHPACRSWYVGSNVAGKAPVFLAHLGGHAAYRDHCDAIATDGYRGFAFT